VGRVLRGYRVEVGPSRHCQSGLNPTLTSAAFLLPVTAKEFLRCRGLVLEHKASGQTAFMPARFVVMGIGSEVNSELLDGQVDMALDRRIKVDQFCRTRSASEVHVE
jgi:thioredoxin reductase